MEYKYKAFISYRHSPRDSAAAKALHTAIERYVIPKKLRKDGKKRMGKVFRDEEELRASSDLSADICQALDQSEYLIVICSPDTLSSHWVPKEIAYFREHRDRKNILTVLTGGAAGEIFPALMPGMPEPLFLDLTQSADDALARELKDRFRKLCAGLLDCEYDDLVRRDEQRRRGQMLAWMGGIAAVAAVIIGILLWSNWQIDGKNQELAQKNEQLEQQNEELLRWDSEYLVWEAARELEKGFQPAAIRKALSALPSEASERPYFAPAEQLLWSELELLDFPEPRMIPRDTILELTSPAEELCFSADGSLLTTIDLYGGLTCFDTSTGAVVWTQRLPGNNSYLLLQMEACHSNGSILILHGQTITCLSQQTGSLLWSFTPEWLDGPFELSDDGTTLVCMTRSDGSHRLSALSISLVDGSILKTCPVAESDGELTVPSNQLGMFFRDIWDISDDGRFFAGCCEEMTGDGAVQQRFFVTDLTTGETGIVYTQPQESRFRNIHYLFFTDGDAALTVIGSSANALYALEKISIPDRSLLWQTEHSESELDLAFDYLSESPVCLLSEHHILVGRNGRFHAFDPETGELRFSNEYSSDVLRLEPVQDRYFAYVLEDGTCNVGWLSSNQFASFATEASPLYSLGSVRNAWLWHGGYLRLKEKEEGGRSNVMAGEIADGFGFAVFVPDDDEYRIVIRRAVSFAPELKRKKLSTKPILDGFEFDSLVPCSEDTIALVYRSIESGLERYRYLLFDRNTLDGKGTFNYERDYASASAPIPVCGGSGLVFAAWGEGNREIDFYDAADQSRTSLTAHRGETTFTVGDVTIPTEARGYVFYRLSGDHSLLTAITTDVGLKLLIDDVPQPDVLCPRELYDENLRLYKPNLFCSGSGILLLDLADSTEVQINSYYLYSIHDGQWYTIPLGEYDRDGRRICMGERTPSVAVLDNLGTLRCQDHTTGAVSWKVPTGLRLDAVKHMQWVAGDRYLMICTGDKLLLLFDGGTGEVLMEYNMESDTMDAAVDPAGDRLYLWYSRLGDGICVDTESMTILATIPEMRFYDPTSDMVFQEFERYYDRGSGLNYLIATRLPTTEELVAMGKEFLGE